jgi:ribokinase
MVTMIRDLDVLVVGDLNPDLILRGDVVPRFGQSEQLLDSADLTVGGSGGIVAHGLARLGRRVALCAAIGTDPFAALMRERLAGAGVEVSTLVPVTDHPTGLTVVLNHEDTRTMLTLVGAIDALEPERIDDALLARARHVHATSFFLQPRLAGGLAELFARARAAGAGTSLDPNVDPAGRWDGLEKVLPLTDVLLPNRAEALALAARYGPSPAGPSAAGSPSSSPPRSSVPSPEDDLARAAHTLAGWGPLVVVKDGEDGALAADPDGRTTRRAGYPVTAIDTTGAGDSFDAAFLAARLAGRSAADCLDIACHAGALSTRGVGGVATQATAPDLAL